MNNFHGPDSSLRMAQGIVRSFIETSEKPEHEHAAESIMDDSEILKSADDAIEVMVTSPEDGIARKHRFQDSFVLIGRSDDCDLSLADDRVSKRHAYLQKIFGRVVCVDLASSNGIYWPDGRRPFGWFDDEHPISIGKFHLHLISPDPHEELAEPEFDPGSFFKTSTQKSVVPKVSLQFLSDAEENEVWTLSRTITLVGSSSCCKLRLHNETVSRVHCSLILLPKGLWIVNLLGTEGTLVNGKSIRSVRLEEGDVFQVGKYAFRVNYLPSDHGSDRSDERIRDHALAGKVVSNEFAGHLIEQIMAMQQQFLQQSQQQTEMMLQFFSTLHSQQHELLSQEMARVRDIDNELRELKGVLAQQSAASASHNQGSPPAVPERVSAENSAYRRPRRLKHIRTAGAPVKKPRSEPSLEEANWKLTKASELERARYEPVFDEPAEQQENEVLPVESSEIVTPDYPETPPEARQEEAITEVVEESLDDSDEQTVAETVEELDSSGFEEESELQDSSEENEDSDFDPDDYPADEIADQRDIDHHGWVLSRMHQLERERDGIFRKMVRAIFPPNS